MKLFATTGNVKVGDTVILGLFDHYGEPKALQASATKAPYFVAYFTHGTLCDITNNARTAEVRVRNNALLYCDYAYNAMHVLLVFIYSSIVMLNWNGRSQG